jgi:hypothetical protein
MQQIYYWFRLTLIKNQQISPLMSRFLAEPIRRSMTVLAVGIVISFSIGAMSQARPEAAPGPVASHPTSIVATVKSVKLLKSLVEVGEKAELGEDSTSDVKVFQVKLDVHQAKPVKPGELTSVQAGSQVEVVTRDLIDPSYVGKRIKGIIETKGDTRKRSLLLSQVQLANARPKSQDKNEQERK